MFKKGLKSLAIIISFWITPAFASSATFYYSDGPWSGRVIDADTKEPIEGAVVLAVWWKSYATPAGNATNYFNFFEVLTDKNGNFLITRYRALNITPILAFIEGPTFTIYKPGYAIFPGFGAQHFDKYFPNSPLKVDNPTMAELFKKGVIIELPRLKSREERLTNMPSLPTDVDAHKLPLFDKVIKEEEKNLGIVR